MKYFYLIVFVALFSSCCTKKDCEIKEYPNIPIGYKGFSSGDLADAKIFLTNKMDYQIIDSSSNIHSINHYFGDKRIEAKDYNFIIVTKFTRDTVHKMDYEYVQKTVDCNSCFLIKDNANKQTTLVNFSFEFKGLKYKKDEAIFIEK